MNFIKKYLFFLICLVVFLLGIIMFTFGMMISSGNAKENRKIESQYKKATKLSRKVIHQNVLDRLENKARQARVDQKAVEAKARKTTSRPLLHQNVFPTPPGQSSVIYYRQFAQQYCLAIDILMGMLNGSDRPSEIEEKNVLENYDKGKSKRRDYSGDNLGYGGNMNFPRRGSRRGTQDNPLIEELRRERAKQISIYANPDSFSCYDYWRDHQGEADGGRDILMLDSWFSQIALWIQEDVITSVGQVNRQSASVLQNPIKRLIEVSFCGVKTFDSRSSMRRGRFDRQIAQRRQVGSEHVLPDYVLSEKGTPGQADIMSGNITTPWTKRASEDLVDVVHFEVAVIIDSTHMIEFINSLQGMKNNYGASAIIDFIDALASMKHYRASEITDFVQSLESMNNDDATTIIDFINNLQKMKSHKASAIIAFVNAMGNLLDANAPEIIAFVQSLQGRDNIAEAARIIDFINTLESINNQAADPKRNQITVLETQWEPVRIQVENENGYYYGSASLTVLRLLCEYSFFKVGYEQLKPKPVKKLLEDKQAS